MCTLVLGLLLLGLTGLATDPVNGELVVDDHWLDLFQQNEQDVLLVKETFWFNNSGAAHYNGSVTVWLPQGAAVATMGVAKEDLSEPQVTTEMNGPHLFSGRVFDDYGPFLTYFGEQAGLELVAATDNSTLRLPLTVALDTPRPSRPVERTGDGLRFSCQDNVSTTNLGEASAVPEIITHIYEGLSLTNEANRSRHVDLSVEGVPTAWKAWMFERTNGSDNLTLEPGESVNLTLHMRIPSYLVKVVVEYAYRMELTGDKLLTGAFETQAVQPTRNIEFYIFSMTGSKVTMSENLVEAYHNLYEPYEREWYIGRGSALAPQEAARISITWDPSTGEEQGPASTSWLWYAGLLVITVVFIGAFLTRSGALANLTGLLLTEADGPGPAEGGGTPPTELDRTRERLEELERRFRRGRLTETEYGSLREELEARLAELEGLANEGLGEPLP